MTDSDLLFYDIEVFEFDSMVVFKDIDKKVVRIFHNDFSGLGELVKGKTLVGFNNHHYDDKILSYMLDKKPQWLIKQLNDKIISGENVKMFKRFKSLDCFQQIDVSRPSLKKIQGAMGRLILESSVPFTIQKPLSGLQLQETLFYCGYDVDTTIDIYKLRIKSYFQPKLSLVDMLGKEEALNWNTTTISANLLLEKPLPKWSSIRISEELLNLVPIEVRDLWLNKDSGAVTIEEFGNEIQFGFGGLHGAHKTKKRAKNVKILDVKSMYPNLILILNALGEASGKYKMILEKRLAVKNFDKILSDALKLILNSVYGNLNNKYSLLYNPMAAKSVCILGQISLYELCRRIAPYVEIININTDGVAFIPYTDAYIDVYREWELDFSLQLDQAEFLNFVQKDVNNYVAEKKDGSLKCKGGDVNRYEKDEFFKNNNARILDIALVDKLLYGKDVLKSIIENLDKPHLFQYILKAGNTYQGTFSEDGREHNKVNRIFASKEKGFCLYKRRFDNGLVRFADAPTSMFLWNDDCDKIENFAEIVDIDHYYQIINKRLERWT